MSNTDLIYFVLYPSKCPWCSNFVADALERYSKYRVIPTDLNVVSMCEKGIIHFENVQLLKRRSVFRGDVKIEKLLRKNIAVTAGVRGVYGLEQMKQRLNELDAIAVNIDPVLQKTVMELHPRTYIVPEGVDIELFKPPVKKPETFTLCWVGRDHKKFKNADLLPRLGYGYKKATYNSYIPHDDMPEFYASANVLVNMSDNEGFCRPILEAASCGLPIVSSDVGVARRILEDQWIVEGDPRENLQEYKWRLELLESDPKLAHDVGALNRERAMKFDWKWVIPQYDRMWDELLVGTILDQNALVHAKSVVH